MGFSIHDNHYLSSYSTDWELSLGMDYFDTISTWIYEF